MKRYVGIFWMDLAAGKVYAMKSSLEDAVASAPRNSPFVHGTADHFTAWHEVRRLNRRWKRVEDYELVPRGRVVWAKQGKSFAVMMNPILKPFEGKVKKAFGLGNAVIRFDYACVEYLTDPETIAAALKE